MSSAITHSQRPQSPSCFMLPYGYQIDLDFIRYCENLTQPDLSDAELHRRQRRRQRQSMEVMLGIQIEMQTQIDQMDHIWGDKKPPEPPPRTHTHLSIESPIVPMFMKSQNRQNDQANWDSSLNDAVHDFEKTLERSKKGKDNENISQQSKNGDRFKNRETGDCMPTKHLAKAPRNANHLPVDSFDGAKLVKTFDETSQQRQIRDLEEQAKLIPLLQIQIQALRDERQHLQSQLETRPSSTSSSSPHPLPQPVFYAQRVSPVSLTSMKIAPVVPKRSNRSTGTNTSVTLFRDVGCSPDVACKAVHKGMSTDLTMKVEGDGGRLYTERDLKKAIEMAHAKMRKSTATIGTQSNECEQLKAKLRSVACGTIVTPTSDASCGTDEQRLVTTVVRGITIEPTIVPIQQTEVSPLSLSLKDMNKSPAQKTSATQTMHPLMHQQATQSSPIVINKATDSTDLIRLVHKMSMTEVSQKRDQMVHTADLVKISQTGTNTPTPVVPLTRSTASNTSAVDVKSVGINCETQFESLGIPIHQGTSKIPRPSPILNQKKFTRQETFTVSTKSSMSDEDIVRECPVEMIKVKKMFEEIFDVKRGRNLLDMFLSPTDEDGMLKDIERLTMRCDGEPINNKPVPKLQSPTHANFNFPLKEPTPEPTIDSSLRKTPSVENIESSPTNDVQEHHEHNFGSSKMPMSPSIEYLDDDDFDDEYDDDDKFNDEHVGPSVPLRPPPTSISTIRLSQQNRVKILPTKEMIAALKVLNDHLQKSPEPDESEIKTAREVASCEWFQISSTETAKPDNVEDYLDFLEEQSWDLLTFIVNLADKNGNTAMHYAVSHGNFDVVSILLDSKVTSINQTNNAGYTCVMLVSLAKLLVSEHRTVVQRLFKMADVNIRATKNSQTALMLAVSHGNATIAAMLVETAADINIQDDDGSTALMCAAEHGHLDIVKYLLAQPDCDSTKVDVDGNTALKISLEAGYHDIGCLLYAHEHLLRSKTSLKRTPSSMKSSTSSLN